MDFPIKHGDFPQLCQITEGIDDKVTSGSQYAQTSQGTIQPSKQLSRNVHVNRTWFLQIREV